MKNGDFPLQNVSSPEGNHIEPSVLRLWGIQIVAQVDGPGVLEIQKKTGDRFGNPWAYNRS